MTGCSPGDRTRMRILCVFLGAAILMSTAPGCDSGGDLKEGVPADAAKAAPPSPTSMPGMDTMKDKMEKKKK